MIAAFILGLLLGGMLGAGVMCLMFAAGQGEEAQKKKGYPAGKRDIPK